MAVLTHQVHLRGLTSTDVTRLSYLSLFCRFLALVWIASLRSLPVRSMLIWEFDYYPCLRKPLQFLQRGIHSMRSSYGDSVWPCNVSNVV